MRTESNKPNFIIVGVPKAGTTSIYRHLRSHPDIFMPDTTELHYFDRDEMLANAAGPGDDKVYDLVPQDWNAYLSYFKNATDEKVIGECTTTYLYSKKAIDRIKLELGENTKIISILRNPVDRAFSNYGYYVRRGMESDMFEQVLADEHRRFSEGWNNAWFNKRHSLYSDKIQHLINSRLPFKVILFEDFVRRPESSVKELYSFLEVDAHFLPDTIGINYNKGGVYKNKRLANWMTSPSVFRSGLKKLIPQELLEKLRHQRDRFLSNQTTSLKIEPGTRKELHEYFREDVLKLNKLIDIDISKWGY